MTASDPRNHELNLAVVRGTQKSADEKWNNAQFTYRGLTDLVEGKGTQRGYFENVHTNCDRDWGTFARTVATKGGQPAVEGKYQFTGGADSFVGLPAAERSRLR